MTGTLYNHDVRQCVDEMLHLSPYYSGRALCLTAPGDVIQIDPALRPLWPVVQAHYARVGLPVTDTVVWDLSLDRLRDHPGAAVSTFMFSRPVHERIPDPAWSAVVERTNAKNQFVSWAHGLGVPVPPTLCVDDAHKLLQVDLERVGFPCFFKPSVSMSGLGIYRVGNRETLARLIAGYPAKVPVQLQQSLPARHFVCLHYRIEDGTLERWLASEQLLVGFSHVGNRVPIPDPPWAVCDPLAEAMRAQGMRGNFAFDVAIGARRGQSRAWVLECNPRVNGSTYPGAVAERLGIEAWTTITLPLPDSDPRHLELGDLAYDPVRRSGAILINWGGLLLQSLAVMLAGPPEVQQSLMTALRARIRATA